MRGKRKKVYREEMDVMNEKNEREEKDDREEKDEKEAKDERKEKDEREEKGMWEMKAVRKEDFNTEKTLEKKTKGKGGTQRKLNKGENILTTEVWQEMPYGQESVRQESQGRYGKCQLPVLQGLEML